MRTDLTPLYRSFVGFDRIADLLETASRADMTASWPPYDIEKTGDDSYRISLAVAGFRAAELEVVSQPNLLVVTGRRADDGEHAYLHRGIAGRAFEQRFNLADHLVVTDARHEDGLLVIDLVRQVPEALKPRRIPIGGQAPQERLDAPNAAAPADEGKRGRKAA